MTTTATALLHSMQSDGRLGSAMLPVAVSKCPADGIRSMVLRYAFTRPRLVLQT
jgi:hypothetical protein